MGFEEVGVTANITEHVRWVVNSSMGAKASLRLESLSAGLKSNREIKVAREIA